MLAPVEDVEEATTPIATMFTPTEAAPLVSNLIEPVTAVLLVDTTTALTVLPAGVFEIKTGVRVTIGG